MVSAHRKTIERITKPSDSPPAPEKWYNELSKQLLIWVGVATLSTEYLAATMWLSSSFADFWVLALGIFVFELMAFGLMSYLRKDFSALPPSIVSFVERVTDREISPIETRAKR